MLVINKKRPAIKSQQLILSYLIYFAFMIIEFLSEPVKAGVKP